MWSRENCTLIFYLSNGGVLCSEKLWNIIFLIPLLLINIKYIHWKDLIFDLTEKKTLSYAV